MLAQVRMAVSISRQAELAYDHSHHFEFLMKVRHVILNDYILWNLFCSRLKVVSVGGEQAHGHFHFFEGTRRGRSRGGARGWGWKGGVGKGPVGVGHFHFFDFLVKVRARAGPRPDPGRH
jgi:hypothetical protein